MTMISWPLGIAPNSIDWWLEAQSRSAGQSLLGNERIISSPSARWRCTMTFRVWGTQGDPSKLLFWRAFAGRMYGRSGSVLIGPFDRLTPALLSGATSRQVLTSFSDGSGFSDGSKLSQSASVGVVSAAAAVGARALTLTYSGGGQIQAGQYFGLGGVSLYLADSVVANNDGSLTLGFSPGLRAACANGDPVDFETPCATMRFMADDGGRSKITIGGVADTTLDLVEVF